MKYVRVGALHNIINSTFINTKPSQRDHHWHEAIGVALNHASLTHLKFTFEFATLIQCEWTLIHVNLWLMSSLSITKPSLLNRWAYNDIKFVPIRFSWDVPTPRFKVKIESSSSGTHFVNLRSLTSSSRKHLKNVNYGISIVLHLKWQICNDMEYRYLNQEICKLWHGCKHGKVDQNNAPVH